MTPQQITECQNKGKDPEVGPLALTIKLHFKQMMSMVDKIMHLYRKIARIISESCTRWTTTRCMCVEPTPLIPSVITW